MTTEVLPVPHDELERLAELSDYDLDYSDLNANLKDLAKLAAKVAGVPISLVNLVDRYTQWTISDYGLSVNQMPREESVCQYTITKSDHFEVTDLSADTRFRDKFYVSGAPYLKYYFGIPLVSGEGHNIGALCVLDNTERIITPEKAELLKIIADEIVTRLKLYKAIEALKNKVHEARDTKSKVAHDIRGPLSGIIGLAGIIAEQGEFNKLEEVLQFIGLIQKSGNSLLDLTDEILSSEKGIEKNTKTLQSNSFSISVFKEKLEKLYLPQAISKNIVFTVKTGTASEQTPISKQKLLQIAGNLISNAIKFTPSYGTVSIELDLERQQQQNILHIIVEDSGVGIDEEKINYILSGNAESTCGTVGENGYGFGLALVKHLVESLKGTMHVTSSPGNGARFYIKLPQQGL